MLALSRLVITNEKRNYFFQTQCLGPEDDIPWGPEYEHDVELEFTPMDPRDYPEVRAPDMYDEEVMILASGNFEREIKRSFMILIFFYKENCQRCQKVDNDIF